MTQPKFSFPLKIKSTFFNKVFRFKILTKKNKIRQKVTLEQNAVSQNCVLFLFGKFQIKYVKVAKCLTFYIIYINVGISLKEVFCLTNLSTNYFTVIPIFAFLHCFCFHCIFFCHFTPIIYSNFLQQFFYTNYLLFYTNFLQSFFTSIFTAIFCNNF